MSFISNIIKTSCEIPEGGANLLYTWTKAALDEVLPVPFPGPSGTETCPVAAVTKAHT